MEEYLKKDPPEEEPQKGDLNRKLTTENNEDNEEEGKRAGGGFAHDPDAFDTLQFNTEENYDKFREGDSKKDTFHDLR